MLWDGSEICLRNFGITVAWWAEGKQRTDLGTLLVRVLVDTARHTGQADIVRELIDGAVGLREGNDNMAPGDKAWWESYRGRLERAAREAGQDVAREAG